MKTELKIQTGDIMHTWSFLKDQVIACDDCSLTEECDECDRCIRDMLCPDKHDRGLFRAEKITEKQ
ncbi:MAG: hypothetical protein LBT24_01560 [Tannerella sp.]|jgi:hypothetical protein|nr:hypothetical protein [Tannerella sp.]